MKVLIIPDTHGSHHWESQIKKFDKFNEIVFLGDYFDSWENNWKDNDQLNNFLHICKLARENPKIKVLIGNHDISYLNHDVLCSGHQSLHANDIERALLDNLDVLNICHVIDGNWICSHAGVTTIWVENNVPLSEGDFHLVEEVAYAINKQFHNKNFKIFGFIDSPRPSVYASPYGDDIWQSPLWVRPYSLSSDFGCSQQIVGHTERNEIEYVTDEKEYFKLILCDTSEHDKFLEFDTENLPVFEKVNFYNRYC